jgi:Ring finger domain
MCGTIPVWYFVDCGHCELEDVTCIDPSGVEKCTTPTLPKVCTEVEMLCEDCEMGYTIPHGDHEQEKRRAEFQLERTENNRLRDYQEEKQRTQINEGVFNFGQAGELDRLYYCLMRDHWYWMERTQEYNGLTDLLIQAIRRIPIEIYFGVVSDLEIRYHVWLLLKPFLDAFCSIRSAFSHGCKGGNRDDFAQKRRETAELVELLFLQFLLLEEYVQETEVFGPEQEGRSQLRIDVDRFSSCKNDWFEIEWEADVPSSLSLSKPVRVPIEQYLTPVPIDEVSQLICSICLESFSGTEECNGETAPTELPVKLPCDHIFGGKFVTAWLNEHNSCPICRRNPRLPQGINVRLYGM